MAPQTSIAHYRISAKLGEGGMGEVCRTTYTKLNRDIALKRLPEAFANERDRTQGFEREHPGTGVSFRSSYRGERNAGRTAIHA